MAKLKVAQCWDDGVATDIRLIEMLRKYNAKATFNLCPGTHADERVEPSRAPEGFTGWSYKGFRGGKIGMKELVDIYGDFEVLSKKKNRFVYRRFQKQTEYVIDCNLGKDICKAYSLGSGYAYVDYSEISSDLFVILLIIAFVIGIVGSSASMKKYLDV